VLLSPYRLQTSGGGREIGQKEKNEYIKRCAATDNQAPMHLGIGLKNERYSMLGESGRVGKLLS